jgi:HPt (histidine-containing phosphotransfer) domain-containing protein
METSAESYLSNVVNGSVTMMAEAGGQARRRRCPASPPSDKKPFESKGFEVEMSAAPAASRSPSPGAVAAAAAGPVSAADQPPVDLVHLARQTDGDAVLQQELLALFDRQSASLLAVASDHLAERRRRADAAHQLKGSALAMGAGAVARAAAVVETALAGVSAGPEAVESGLAALTVAVAAARSAIAKLRD